MKTFIRPKLHTMTAVPSDSVGSKGTIKIMANIFISFIGAGILGLPYAFMEVMKFCYFYVRSGPCPPNPVKKMVTKCGHTNFIIPPPPYLLSGTSFQNLENTHPPLPPWPFPEETTLYTGMSVSGAQDALQ